MLANQPASQQSNSTGCLAFHIQVQWCYAKNRHGWAFHAGQKHFMSAAAATTKRKQHILKSLDLCLISNIWHALDSVYKLQTEQACRHVTSSIDLQIDRDCRPQACAAQVNLDLLDLNLGWALQHL